jgi:hypothetical protein
MKKKTDLKPGDRVAYTRAFVRNTGSMYEMAQMRGTVESVAPFSEYVLCKVRWDGEDEAMGVLACNICRIRSAAFAD